MWTAPAPGWNQTVEGYEANIKTAVIQVLNGSTNALIKWNYNLLGNQGILSASFTIDTKHIGVASKGKSNIEKYLRNRFSIESTGEVSSLTIFLVTERENATFQCRLLLADLTSWAYNIRIEVTGTTTVIAI